MATPLKLERIRNYGYFNIRLENLVNLNFEFSTCIRELLYEKQ